MSSPISLGRLSVPPVVLATVAALAAAVVLVALGDGGVPERMRPSAAPATTAQPPAQAPTFEANRGQADGAVEFLSRGSGYTLFLTGTEAVLKLEAGEPGTTRLLGGGTLTRGSGTEADGAVVRMGLAGAAASPEVAGRARQAATRTGIPTYGRVQYTGVYPGIDMAWYGNAAGLEYDFEVAAGADPSRIGLTFEGAESVTVGGGGELVVKTAAGTLTHRPPYAYQQEGGTRTEVESGYVVRGDGTVGFELGAYDRERPLVIGPQLLYSTSGDRR